MTIKPGAPIIDGIPALLYSFTMDKSLEHLLDGITLDPGDKTRAVMSDAHRFLQSLETLNDTMSDHALAYGINDELVITMRPDGETYCDVRFTGGDQSIVDAQLYIEDEQDCIESEAIKTNENMSIHDVLNLIRDYDSHEEDDNCLNNYYHRSMMVLVDPGDDFIEVLKEDNGIIGPRYKMNKTRDEILKLVRRELEDRLRSDDSSKELKALFKSILDSGDEAILGYLHEKYLDNNFYHTLPSGHFDKDYNLWSFIEDVIYYWFIPNDNNKVNENLLQFSGAMNGRKTVKESDNALSRIASAGSGQGAFAYKPVGTDRYVVGDLLEKEKLNPDAKIFIIKCEHIV